MKSIKTIFLFSKTLCKTEVISLPILHKNRIIKQKRFLIKALKYHQNENKVVLRKRDEKKWNKGCVCNILH